MLAQTSTQSSSASLENSFAALFEESLARQEMRIGEVITAEVISVDPNVVIVNAGLKSESTIATAEFKNDRGEIEVAVGDFVSVAIEALEDGFGATKLSRDKAKKLAAWTSLDDALANGTIIKGVVSGKVKGGLTVMVNGIRAFLPGSLVDLRPVKDTSHFENKELEFKVIKLDRKRNNVVVSRRAVMEETAGVERQQLLETLKEGAVVKGVVKNITDYGAFVDLGGIDGLLHITDLAWRRVKHPTEVLSVGDEVTAKILKFDAEKNRVSLGLKQAMANPWDAFVAAHPIGSTVEGEVKNATEFGLFIGLDNDIDGMVHLSDLDWAAPGEEAIAKYNKGEMVKARVLDVDVEKERISLGIKQLAGDPMTGDTFRKGQTVTVTVTEITSGGIEVKFGEDEAPMTAFIRKSDLSRDRADQRPERFAVGDRLDAQIANVDKAARRVSLSVKALEMAEEKEAIEKFGASDSGASLGDILGAALREKAQKD